MKRGSQMKKRKINPGHTILDGDFVNGRYHWKGEYARMDGPAIIYQWGIEEYMVHRSVRHGKPEKWVWLAIAADGAVFLMNYNGTVQRYL